MPRKATPTDAIRVIAVGRARGSPESMLFERYAMRSAPPVQLTEIAEARGAPAEIRRREGARLIAALPDRAFAVTLDPRGAAPGSEALAALLSRWTAAKRPLCFLIGGAEGLDAAVLARADAVLSLGPLTWPHLLARAMLAEQLFRARTIAAGHPYHRGNRS
jgi:23S rRNA (pseudouridine1915-N3)-methyltransferase